MARCQIGTSGYQYDHWRALFYPEELPRSRWLPYYAERFSTVELNNCFYRLPSAAAFERWAECVPDDFCFALKFSRYGSHLMHLKNPDNTITNFVDRARLLGSRLGPILVQLPPRWTPNVERLAEFLAHAPRWLRWAVELRDPRWLRADVFGVLREHQTALCQHDLLEDHPREVTADFVYLRFHGVSYAGCYSPQQLSAAARRIAGYLSRGLDVYAYFNNDLGGHAVTNALDLRRYVRHVCDTGASTHRSEWRA